MRKVTGVQRPQKKNQGGMLHGPSHEQGGIPAIVGGSTPVELEGGEYIVNAQTVEAVGQPFLDKLNSTQTEYHTGGFEQGHLPGPSNFDRGGRVNKRKKLQTGGPPGVVYNPGPEKVLPVSKLREAYQGCPLGYYMKEGSCFPMNTSPTIIQEPFQKGGKVKSTRRMTRGGAIKNKKLSNKLTKPVRRNNINRPTPKSMGSGGHSHKMDIDIYGNGYTTGGNHTHQVKGHEIQMNCDDGCHSH
tara:strand:- start:343 stop:1071 length:729 start_codon:yes stop_codon:yes gene_type:complete